MAALQQLARALAVRLTQDVDSVLRDVQLWLAPPFAPRAVPPRPPSSSGTPWQGSFLEASGRAAAVADAPARAEGAIALQ